MLQKSTILVIAGVSIIAGLGCSRGSSPTIPQPNTTTEAQGQISSTDSHRLLSFDYVFVDASDPGNITWEVVPVRDAAKHWNILTFLENGPCTNCFKLAGITPSGLGTLYVDVQVKSPYPSANLTGFDVRGIAMFNASAEFPASGLSYSERALGDGAVVAPDGYTTLYNSTTLGSGLSGLEGYRKGKYATSTAPDALLNPYMRFISDDPANTRNAFYAGDTVTVTYEVAMPTSGFIFGYAVDASWAQPVHKPVTDPMTDFGPDANCPEPWKIDASSSHIGPWGNADVTIDVYDWQGKASHKAPVLECPDLFDGEITATFGVSMPGFSRYGATLSNDKSAPEGTYKCLISVEDNSNDPAGKPWLDLTAYQIVDIVVSPEFNLTEITPSWLNGMTEDYEIDGNLVYMASAFNGVQVFDISNPSLPIWIERIPIGDDNDVYDVSISNGYLYAATFGTDLFVIDADPIQDAHVVNQVHLAGSAFALDVSGSTLYVASTGACPNGLLHILDISDPTSPSLVNSVDFTGFPSELRASGGYVYVAGGDGGLLIFDVDPPGSASLIKIIDTTGPCNGVWIDGSYAYAASGSQGLQIIDISAPDSASIINSISLPSTAYDVAVSAGYAYVADYDSGVQVVDIDPPASASVVNTVTSPFWLKDCNVEGNDLVAGTGCGTMIIDLTDPLAADTKRVINYPGPTRGVCTTGDRVFAANDDGGTIIVNTTDPASALVSNVVPTGMTYETAVDENYVYVLTTISLLIIDASVPGSENVLKSLPFSGGGNDLTVAGGYAYVAAGDDGLFIFDVDPPGSASQVGSAILTNYADSVGVQASYAYVGTENYPNFAISVVDVNPPGSASEVLTIPMTSQAYDFAFSGNYSYIANEDVGLTMLDITNPASPTILGSANLTGYAAEGIEIMNNYAFVLDYSNGLIVVDISNPAAPVEKTYLNVAGYKQDVALFDKYAYIASMDSGIHIVRLW